MIDMIVTLQVRPGMEAKAGGPLAATRAGNRGE